jgi:hypothetical protein
MNYLKIMSDVWEGAGWIPRVPGSVHNPPFRFSVRLPVECLLSPAPFYLNVQPSDSAVFVHALTASYRLIFSPWRVSIDLLLFELELVEQVQTRLALADQTSPNQRRRPYL